VISNDEIQRHLDMWLEVDESIAKGGQSYTIGNRAITRADLKEVRANIDYWEAKLTGTT